MRKGQYIAIIAAIGLLAALFFWGNTTPPPKEMKPGAQAAGAPPTQAVPVASTDSVLEAARSALAGHALQEIQAIEKQMAATSDSLQMAPLFSQIGDIWKEHKQPAAAAWYYSKAAKLENSEKKLTFAARLFLELARKEHSQPVQMWEAGEAISSFSKVLEINPANDSAKILLAECYFGTGEAMKGVVLLKEITAKDPDHTGANLMLGQQGLVSGQFDKAKARFETVLKREPKNTEALIGLAEAYKGLGDKGKAIELFEQCKKIMNNPEFSKDIDNYIKSFK